MDFPDSIIKSELSLWNDGRGINPTDWIACVGRYDHFAGYIRLIWPEFIEHNNRIYFSDYFEVKKLESMLKSGWTAKQSQAAINALILPGPFVQENEDVQDDVLIYLAKNLKHAWQAKLHNDFPERKFTVFIQDDLEEQNIGELIVSFCEDET